MQKFSLLRNQKEFARAKAGFTLLEMLLSVALLGMLLGVGAPLVQSFQVRNDLDVAQNTLVQSLRRAKVLSESGSSDGAWGVHVQSGGITVFQGVTYAARILDRDEVIGMPTSISPTGLTDLIFTKITGLPGATGTFTLTSVNNESRAVSINSIGTISYAVTGGVIPPPTPAEMDVTNGVTAIPVGSTHAQGNQIFGSVQTVTYTVTNSGGTALTLSPLQFNSQSNVSGLSVSPALPASLAAGGSVSVIVSYTPVAAGAFSFGISIANSDSNENPYTWTTSGTGVSGAQPEMDVTFGVTAIADNGTHAVGNQVSGSAQTITYTITNSGTANLVLSPGVNPVVATASTNVSAVSITVQPATTIVPSGTTSFTVAYTPTAVGAFSLTVSMGDNDSNENPYNWTVSGTGTAAPVPEMDVTSGGALADGGTQNVGSHASGAVSTVAYTVTNSGTAALTMSAMQFSGATNVSGLSVSPALPASLAAGANVTVTVSYTPTAAGAFSFAVSIPNNDSNENPYNWTVTGTAPTPAEMDVDHSGEAITDGSTEAIGTWDRGVTVQFLYTITNTGGTTLTLSPPVSVSGSGHVSGVSITAQPPATVAPGSTVTFILEFTPTTLGTFTITVSLGNSDSNENPYNWTVSGTSVKPGTGGGGGCIGGGCP